MQGMAALRVVRGVQQWVSESTVCLMNVTRGCGGTTTAVARRNTLSRDRDRVVRVRQPRGKDRDASLSSTDDQ